MELLVKFTTQGILARSASGSTPLHVATQKGYAAIANILLEAGPPELLHMENGVGETAVNLAYINALVERIEQFNRTDYANVGQLNVDRIDEHTERFNVARLEIEIPMLWETIDQLLKEGRLRPGTQLTDALQWFAKWMEAKFRRAKEINDERTKSVKSDKDDRAPGDRCDHQKTLEYLKAGIVAKPGKRDLVHLIDVQRSIEGEFLTRRAGEQIVSRHNDYDGLEPEESAEKQERRGSMALQALGLSYS